MENYATDSASNQQANMEHNSIRTTTSTFIKRGSSSQKPAQRIETPKFYKPHNLQDTDFCNGNGLEYFHNGKIKMLA